MIIKSLHLYLSNRNNDSPCLHFMQILSSRHIPFINYTAALPSLHCFSCVLALCSVLTTCRLQCGVCFLHIFSLSFSLFRSSLIRTFRFLPLDTVVGPSGFSNGANWLHLLFVRVDQDAKRQTTNIGVVPTCSSYMIC